ncbi:hypothetical protein SH501x_001272 [Pirellulaceae bacterium SH501]
MTFPGCLARRAYLAYQFDDTQSAGALDTNLNEYNRDYPPASTAHAISIPDSLLFLEKPQMLRPVRLAAFALAFLLAAFSSVGAELRAQDKIKSPLDRMIPQSDLRSGRLYNERGSSIGRVESRNGSTRAFDATGKSIGRSDSRNGSTRFYDRSGASLGRAESSGTSTRFFDKSGRSVGSSRTSGSTTRYYGPSGSYQGRSQTTNGTTRYYDSTGRSLGTKRP